MSFTDFPNELIYHLFRFAPESQLMGLRRVDRRFNSLAADLLDRHHILPQTYEEAVDCFRRGQWYSIKCAIDLGQIQVQDVIRFEGFIQRPRHFREFADPKICDWSLCDCDSTSHYLAGLAESRPRVDVVSLDNIERDAIAVIVGAARACNWPLVNKVIDHIEYLQEVVVPLGLGCFSESERLEEQDLLERSINRGCFSLDKLVPQLVEDKHLLPILDRVLKLNVYISYSYDVECGIDPDYLIKVMTYDLEKNKNATWGRQEGHWLVRCLRHVGHLCRGQVSMNWLCAAIEGNNFAMFQFIASLFYNEATALLAVLGEDNERAPKFLQRWVRSNFAQHSGGPILGSDFGHTSDDEGESDE
jgi:hypothetical protein